MNGACITGDHSHNSCVRGRTRSECVPTTTVAEESGSRPLPVPIATVLRPCSGGMAAREEPLERRAGNRIRSTG